MVNLTISANCFNSKCQNDESKHLIELLNRNEESKWKTIEYSMTQES